MHCVSEDALGTSGDAQGQQVLPQMPHTIYSEMKLSEEVP